jgi:hypothetical protein
MLNVINNSAISFETVASKWGVTCIRDLRIMEPSGQYGYIFETERKGYRI